jgi:porphobilinogen synthase
MDMIVRPRRLRTTEAMRKMVRETRVDKSSLIYPIFTIDGTGIKEEIPSMPGQYRYSVDQFPYALEEAAKLGVNNILLFGIPEHKDEVGSQAYAHDGIVQRALREGKKHFPDMIFIADVCMCEYTSHGHCGILHGDYVDNDDTLEKLAIIASSQAEAGADIVAPSDMMDGHVTAIRQQLDKDGFKNTPIMSYAVKFASAFYGPFRDAADSAPCFGDRKSYQMDFHNGREAMKEALLDVEEGTDFLIVKPAMAYYDLLEKVVSATNIPVATYSVSGEYSMVKAAAQNGWIDEDRIISEMAVGAYRSGAGMYITYFAKELARLIDEGKIG